jgi:LysM repeat protein
MFAQVYIVAILAVFAQPVFAATCSRTYTIKAGDFCDKISQAQNVSTYQLAAINPAIINKGCSNLTPGESICLGLVGEDCSTTQVVQPGDTCAGIAATNGLNMTILRLNNPQLDNSCDIYVGEVLCTSKKVQVPAIPSSGITVTVSTGQSAPVSTIIPAGPSSKTSIPTSVVAPPANSPAPTNNHVAQTTPSAPKPTDNGDDSNDDDNLPFCDEL